MKKQVGGLLLAVCISSGAYAKSGQFAGVGMGYAEACRTQGAPSFAGGDCIVPNIDFRGLVGYQLNSFISVEGGLDVALDAGEVAGEVLSWILDDNTTFSSNANSGNTITTQDYGITTVYINALGYLPINQRHRLFTGPVLGASLVSLDYQVTYFGRDYGAPSTPPLSPNDSGETTTFSFNYGWVVGWDVFDGMDSAWRVQWQNMRRLKADAVENRIFNTNTFSVNAVYYLD